MDVNSISCILDCKVDIREKKYEFPLRSWQSYFVKIESIKCFPCYIKVSIFKEPNLTETNLILRINIPGLTVLPANSRTKQHAYGLFWKNNRKKCCAFFAFESKSRADSHMNWLQTQIKILETYRQEILQNRRASRFKLEQSMNTNTTCDESVIYQNLDETKNIKDVYDILGPLPKLPESAADNWSRRISGMSGIYEEIVDPPRRGVNKRGNIRESIASGIYEEMHLISPENKIDEETSSHNTSIPPPLPARTRINTDCSLKRSFTTPESYYTISKKKSWNLFGNVFSRSKKRHDKSQQDIMKSKRNSFSSPDLSHLYCGGEELDVSGTCSGELNCSFDVGQRSNSTSSNSSTYMLEHLYENDPDSIIEVSHTPEVPELPRKMGIYDSPKSLNISHNISTNMDVTMNGDISRINLVGNSCKTVESIYEKPVARVSPTMKFESVPGYMEMGPGRGFDRKKVEEMDRKQLELNLRSDFYRIEYKFNSPITFRRGEENHYENMEKTGEENVYINMESPKSFQKKLEFVFNDEFAQNLEAKRGDPVSSGDSGYSGGSPRNSQDDASSDSKSENPSVSEANKKCLRNSVDDKIASYFPNLEFKPKPAPAKKQHVRSSTTDGVFHYHQQPLEVESKKSSKHQKSPKKKATKHLRDQENYHSDEDQKFKKPSNDLDKKYATLGRCTVPPTCQNDLKNVKSSSSAITRKFMDLTSPKFASLPRFKKLDFSPLRMKISSVLQRHNSEGM